MSKKNEPIKGEIQLDPWQKEILDYEGNILLCTGRQVGKTTIFAHKAGKLMIDKPNTKIIVVSLTEDQAQLIILMTLDYIERRNKNLIKKPYGKNATKNKINITNGSTIIARPVGNTGDAVRGFTGDILIIDEASRMPEMMWHAAKPTLATTGGKIWMCSTPHGKQGYFYECFQNKHNRYKIWHVNTIEVYENREIKGNWTEHKREEALRFLEEERKDTSELQFRQEYLGEFLDDIRQLFSDELIRKCMNAVREQTINHESQYYLGVDVARMGIDDSTFEVIKKISKTNLIHVENISTKKTYLTDTANLIFSLHHKYNFNKIYIDDEGIGIAVFDMLLANERTKKITKALRNSKKVIDFKTGPNGKVKGYKRMLKEDLYMNLLGLMERGEISLLQDDDVFLSFKSVQYEFEKDKTGKTFMRIFGKYTHIVEGIIRAAQCSKEKDLNWMFDSISI